MNCANLLGRLRRWCLFTLLLAVSMPMTSYGAVMNFTLMAEEEEPFKVVVPKLEKNNKWLTGDLKFSFREDVTDNVDAAQRKTVTVNIRREWEGKTSKDLAGILEEHLNNQLKKDQFRVTKKQNGESWELTFERNVGGAWFGHSPNGMQNPAIPTPELWGELAPGNFFGKPDMPKQVSLRQTPEPGSFAIMGFLGLGGATMRRWRKSKLKEQSDDSFPA